MRSDHQIYEAIEEAEDTGGPPENDNEYMVSYLSTIKKMQKIIIELLLDIRAGRKFG